MDQLERWERIHKLERQYRERQADLEAMQRRYEQMQSELSYAIQVYCDALSQPWKILAAELERK